MKFLNIPLTLFCILILSGCASSPKVSTDADRSLTPKEAATSPASERRLQWGGVIIESQNMADTTELQVLAYPLKSDGKPDVKATPNGRFIAQSQGYLETVNYAKGRQVTVTGKFSQVRTGEVGETPYEFPILTADEVVLWPEESVRKPKPRVNFGFGVGSGGRSWGGVGVGVGF
ncbi:MAG: Slp family lipoprotein [Candidatus Thiodiazotropha sp. (ex Monitilora ramsayi)]|nr:Slp family lipoprotein [Candidatus Thiodiazotropha sp. (ex Monitilora ramsayi)]